MTLRKETMAEFGRTARSNGTRGTDQVTGPVVFVPGRREVAG